MSKPLLTSNHFQLSNTELVTLLIGLHLKQRVPLLARVTVYIGKTRNFCCNAVRNMLEESSKLLTIFNNYWMRLSRISRIIEAEVGVICRSRRLRNHLSHGIIYLLFFVRIILWNYSLLFFVRKQKPDLLVLQTIIICKRDVIITEYQELFVYVTS